MRKRGITDLTEIQLDNWAVGQVAPQHQGKRLLRAVSYYKGKQTNFYGRPTAYRVSVADAGHTFPAQIHRQPRKQKQKRLLRRQQG